MYALPETGIVEASSEYDSAENRQVTPASAKLRMIEGPPRPIALADDHEDAGADDGADAERREVQDADGALEAVLPAGLGRDLLVRLAGEDPAPASARREHVVAMRRDFPRPQPPANRAAAG